jgi:hypothetical protein
MGIVAVLSGCAKKQEPPASPPAPTQTSDAAKEAQTQAAEATKDSQTAPGFDSKVFLAQFRIPAIGSPGTSAYPQQFL